MPLNSHWRQAVSCVSWPGCYGTQTWFSRAQHTRPQEPQREPEGGHAANGGKLQPPQAIASEQMTSRQVPVFLNCALLRVVLKQTHTKKNKNEKHL